MNEMRDRKPIQSRRTGTMAGLLAAVGFTIAGTGSAIAHPHVFIESRTEVVINKDHQITGLRHKWVFDEQYTSFALVGLDMNKDGKYSTEELAPLAKENIESLHEFGFFTYPTKAEKAIELKQPENYKLTYKGKVLTLVFTLPLKQPVSVLGNPVKLSIYDPEFYIAFLEPENKSPVYMAASAPKNCLHEKRKASFDQTGLVESRLGQPMDLTNEENKGFGAMFAPHFLISCLAEPKKQ